MKEKEKIFEREIFHITWGAIHASSFWLSND
jgi:hypothetical protein